MPALGEHGDLPGLEVARVDGAFFAAGEDGDHTTEGGGLLEEGQEVGDESVARIGYQRGGVVEAFWRLCVRTTVRHCLSHLQTPLREPGQCWKTRAHTRPAKQRPCAENQEIDRLLFALDVPADIVHGADQAGVSLDEEVLALGVQRLAFGRDAISGFLRAPDEIDARLAGMLGELLQRRFADAAGGADEDGDETRRESGGDAGVRGLYVFERDHCGGCERGLENHRLVVLKIREG